MSNATRALAVIAAVGMGFGSMLAVSPADAVTSGAAALPAAAVVTTNACANPVLASDLSNWGPLDGAAVSRDSVGDLPGASWAFDTAGHSFYQPQLTVTPGQTWTMSARDRVLGAKGSVVMSVDWYDASGAYLSTATGTAVSLPQSSLSGGTWTPVTVRVTAPPKAVSAHIVQTGAFGAATHTAFKATECDYELTSPSGASMPTGDLPSDPQGPRGCSR